MRYRWCVGGVDAEFEKEETSERGGDWRRIVSQYVTDYCPGRVCGGLRMVV